MQLIFVNFENYLSKNELAIKCGSHLKKLIKSFNLKSFLNFIVSHKQLGYPSASFYNGIHDLCFE